MKFIKFLLVIVVLVPIGYFVFISIEREKSLQIEPIVFKESDKNVEDIRREISSLRNLSSERISTLSFESIQNKIDENHKAKLFSQKERDNDNYRLNLSKDLFSAYALHFVEYCRRKFKSGTCLDSDFRQIQSEALKLSRSTYLEKGAELDVELKTIQATVSKYFEIRNFINSCNNYSFIYYGMDIIYPVDEDLVKVERARAYIDKKMENVFLNNCANLKSMVSEIPVNLFNAHFEYLNNKIQKNLNRFNEFKYQSEYSNSVYSPLKRQIDLLYADAYNMREEDIDFKYQQLEILLNTDNKKAIEYFRNLEE